MAKECRRRCISFFEEDEKNLSMHCRGYEYRHLFIVVPLQKGTLTLKFPERIKQNM